MRRLTAPRDLATCLLKGRGSDVENATSGLDWLRGSGVCGIGLQGCRLCSSGLRAGIGFRLLGLQRCSEIGFYSSSRSLNAAGHFQNGASFLSWSERCCQPAEVFNL